MAFRAIDVGSNPAGGIIVKEKPNEKKFKKMEKKRPDEMEVAEKKDQEREEKTKDEILRP